MRANVLPWPCLAVALSILLATSSFCSASVLRENVLRWDPERPNCAFTQSRGGTYRYSLTTSDLAITLAVDAQELDKVRRRVEPVFSLFLSVRDISGNALELDPSKISLEFVHHFRDKQTQCNRDLLSSRLHKDSEILSRRTFHAIRRHPEKQQDIEANLRDGQHKIAEMIEFLQAKTLQPAKLDSEKPEVAGWLLFPARGRWIGELGAQEEFVLRVPIEDTLFEFPFTLPPSERDIPLRTRPD